MEPTSHILVSRSMQSVLESLTQMGGGKSKEEVLQKAVVLYKYLVEQSSTSDVILRNRYTNEEKRVDLGIVA